MYSDINSASVRMHERNNLVINTATDPHAEYVVFREKSVDVCIKTFIFSSLKEKSAIK